MVKKMLRVLDRGRANECADHEMFGIGLSKLDHPATLQRKRVRHPGRSGAGIHHRGIKLPRQRLTHSGVHYNFGTARPDNNFLFVQSCFSAHK